jgi:hypothetical protein
MSSTVFFADTSGNELAKLTNVWTVAGTPTDPTAVSLVVTDPAGAQVTYTYAGSQITKVSTGKYTINVGCLLDGLWSYVWIGTGTAADIAAGTWTVAPATVGHWYTSVAELKSRLQITDTVDDFECTLAVQAAAAWVEQFCGRFFWNETGVRTYRNTSIYDVDIDDLVSITSLATDTDGDGVYDTAWTPGQYQLQVTEHEYNQASKGEPWPWTKIQALGVPGGNYLPYVWAWSHQDRVQVTGVFGWPAVPVLVRQASLQLSADYLKLRDAPFGVVGFGEYGAMRVIENPAIAGMLRRYVKPRRKVGV